MSQVLKNWQAIASIAAVLITVGMYMSTVQQIKADVSGAISRQSDDHEKIVRQDERLANMEKLLEKIDRKLP